MQKTNTHVLLVGDNRELLALTARLLRRSGYDTSCAVGMKEARQTALETPPQLIVMDCDLPDGSGMCACRRLRQEKLPVRILLTSNDAGDELNALNAGADDFVKKPYRMEVLLARMKRLQPLE